MVYRATLKRLTSGRWYARCEAGPSGLAQAEAASREEALDGLRKEIRYQLELCPCSGVSREFVELDVRDHPPSPAGD